MHIPSHSISSTTVFSCFFYIKVHQSKVHRCLYTIYLKGRHTSYNNYTNMLSNINRCRLGLETSQPRVAGGRAVSGDGWWLPRVDSGRRGVRWNRNGSEFDQDEVIVMRIFQERTSESILNYFFFPAIGQLQNYTTIMDLMDWQKKKDTVLAIQFLKVCQHHPRMSPTCSTFLNYADSQVSSKHWINVILTSIHWKKYVIHFKTNCTCDIWGG